MSCLWISVDRGAVCDCPSATGVANLTIGLIEQIAFVTDVSLIIPAENHQQMPRSWESSLTKIRSHDQYNTTIYGMNDRHHGITRRRDVVFVNECDLASRGLKHGDLVDVTVVPDAGAKPRKRAMRNLTAVAYPIAQGSIAI